MVGEIYLPNPLPPRVYVYDTEWVSHKDFIQFVTAIVSSCKITIVRLGNSKKKKKMFSIIRDGQQSVFM